MNTVDPSGSLAATANSLVVYWLDCWLARWHLAVFNSSTDSTLDYCFWEH